MCCAPVPARMQCWRACVARCQWVARCQCAVLAAAWRLVLLVAGVVADSVTREHNQGAAHILSIWPTRVCYKRVTCDSRTILVLERCDMLEPCHIKARWCWVLRPANHATIVPARGFSTSPLATSYLQPEILPIGWHAYLRDTSCMDGTAMSRPC